MDTDQKKHTGLNDAEVTESRRLYGANVLTPPQQEPLWKQFLEKFSDPLIIILMVAGVLSIGISCYEYFGLDSEWAVFFEPIGIYIAILLATGLAFYFEYKANKAFSLLNQVSDDEQVKVVRNGQTTTIPRKEVVVGDVVLLNAGDEVPADGILFKATCLHVDESSLTGEPVCTKTVNPAQFDPEATYPSDHVLRGTKVMEGHGRMVVEAVGDATENGKVYVEAQIDDGVKTPLNEQLDGLGRLITQMSYAIAALIIVGRLVHYFNWEPLSWSLALPTGLFFWLAVKRFPRWNSKTCLTVIAAFFALFIFMVISIHDALLPDENLPLLLGHTLNTLMIAVTLIVVAVPEGLPMAVTLSLAYSMRSMLKTNNLVRKMHACETMGATTVICTDKTGTLTQNRMQVHEARFFGIHEEASIENEDKERLVAQGIVSNSTASLDLSQPEDPKVIGNPTEGALLLWLHTKGADLNKLKNNVETEDEIPFSTERKYMASLVRTPEGRQLLFVKGAPEIVLGLCTSIDGHACNDDIVQLLADYQRQAMRTLAFAYQEILPGDKVFSQNRIAAERLVFLGIVAISDPVREDVPEAVKVCMEAGIAIKIVTGDNSGTAREIGRQIGLWKETDTERNIITGPEFAALSDAELSERVNDLKIIARARPMDKKRLVEALREKNHIVAVTGDGTNDAPALNAAHVGLSMGDGTSVAKEASDITIIDNSFSSIGRAVMWGRSLYRNIQRFLLFQLTVNVSACCIVLIGAFIGTESPLTVTQMLWVNLIMDTFGAMALASLPPSPAVMKDRPRKRNAFILTPNMFKNILGVGLAFFAMLLALLYIFQHADINSMDDIFRMEIGAPSPVTPYEQTLLFSIFVWTHFWYMFNARSYDTGKSFFRTRLSKGFKTIATIIFVGQIVIIELLNRFFNVEPMFINPAHPHSPLDWLAIFVLSSSVLWIREVWQLLKTRHH